MAEVDYLDSSTWRLKRFGIPIKIVQRGGSFGTIDDDSTGFEIILVSADQLDDFRKGVFPEEGNANNVFTAQAAPMPGLEFLRADDLTWKAHNDSRPTDPFATDTTAPENTYHPVVEVTITYRAKDQPPLELTATSTGEFIHGGGGPCWWLPTRGTTQNEAVRNKKKNIPVPIVVPETDWSLRWPRFGGQHIERLIPRLRARLGKVNSKKMKILFDAVPETIMFVGWDYRESPTFASANVDSIIRAKFVEITLKFLEKNVEDKDGNVRGHNDFWQEGKGWQYLRCGTEKGNLTPVHDPVDLNEIFDLALNGECTWRWDASRTRWEVIRTNCIEGFKCGNGPDTAGTTDGEEKTLPCIPA